MAYIDYTFYTDVYKGVQLDADTFSRLAERAGDVIDQVTNYQIGDITQYPEWIQSLIKKAVAAQVEYLYYAGETAIHGDAFGNVKLGDFTYSSSGSQQTISPAVINYLRPTGLLYRGVTVHG